MKNFWLGREEHLVPYTQKNCSATPHSPLVSTIHKKTSHILNFIKYCLVPNTSFCVSV